MTQPPPALLIGRKTLDFFFKLNLSLPKDSTIVILYKIAQTAAIGGSPTPHF